MPCGFPLPPVLKPTLPSIDLPEVPALLPLPDLSWALDLGLDLAVIPPSLPVPEIDVPSVPVIPPAIDFSWSADLGLDLATLRPELPVPELDLPSVPLIPFVPEIPCPFDDEV
jgi:hypothetical protein